MMNNTVLSSAIHETITHSVKSPQEIHQHAHLDFMMIIRILWYVFCLAKVVSIALFARPKPSISERVLRKLLISHNQLLRSFSDEDKKSMEQLLSNTIKNASSIHQSQNSKLRKTEKKVIFEVNKNNYYEPRIWKQDQPVFYDVINSEEHLIKLHPTESFEQKKHQEEYIERQDLLGLNEKSEELQETNPKGNQNQQQEEEILPLDSKIQQRQAQTKEQQQVLS